ncbi:hypothetical protein [Sphingomonas pokkalii]|uniref:EF-hand domain-containing protein n=1 Tax=Sphingomonas pokkalii TaxID=2175090 RepID=A0A2U0SC87_9SPHN|nr:hypothetical protein [Sphingomonas pokkalii]PVX28987.1 hypothetical protein DD559_06265 [Sphingomonas pokkalii]
MAAGLIALLTGACALNAQTGIAVGAGVTVAVNDRDGDGMLDAGEVQAMVERVFPPATLTGGFWDGMRASVTAAYWSKDRNRDGRLSPVELAR